MNKNVLTTLIEACQSREQQEPRDYIGASSIGSDCLRQIWYQFKGKKAESVPSSFVRAWRVGHTLERLIIDWVVEAGVAVDTSDFTYHAENMPYFKSHFDGIMTWKNEKSILEIKTAKHASFTIFVNKGLKIWNPQYYAQIQSYMGMSGIHKAYILVFDKDTSRLSDELVLFDSGFYEKLCEKARMIHNATIEPPKINGSPLFFKCKMCKYNKVCHE